MVVQFSSFIWERLRVKFIRIQDKSAIQHMFVYGSNCVCVYLYVHAHMHLKGTTVRLGRVTN